MQASKAGIRYRLQLVTTEDGTGMFACRPDPEHGFEIALDLLRASPLDDFLHKHLLQEVLRMDRGQVETMARQATEHNDRLVLALLHEARIIRTGLGFPDLPKIPDLSACTPLGYLRRSNSGRDEGRPQSSLPDRDDQHFRRPADLAACFAAVGRLGVESDRCSPEQTIARALEGLEKLGILAGPETRHVASLSPIAYLRCWQLDISVFSGRNRYRLEGKLTAYGRGLSPEAARASCLMEIVERASSFVSVDERRLPDAACLGPLLYGSRDELQKKGLEATDPDSLGAETVYKDEELYWLEGCTDGGSRIYLPAQAVLLFCNLDEPNLFGSLDSTGLAAGNTDYEARLAGLLEVLERHADQTRPLDSQSCFRLKTSNPCLEPLFKAYRRQGIDLWFQDITTTLGIPAYRCFVRSRQGKLVQGTGAHLDGRKAIMAALTETPYPFPAGPSSGAGPPGLPRRSFEDLPNYDTNCSAANLRLIADHLRAFRLEPLYVNLTGKDLGIPVWRAFLPGLEQVVPLPDKARG